MPEHKFEVTAIVVTGQEPDVWNPPPNLIHRAPGAHVGYLADAVAPHKC